MSLDQALDRSVCPCNRAAVLKQPAVMMGGEHDAEELEGQLPRIGLGIEVALVDAEPNRFCDRAAEFALPGGEQIADRARPIVVFGRGGKDEARAPRIVRFDRREPSREQGTQARQPAGLLGRAGKHVILKERLRALERKKLEIFLGAEVGEESALRELESRGEGAYGEAFEADAAGKADRLVEDQVPGLLAFTHLAIIIRTFVSAQIPLFSDR